MAKPQESPTPTVPVAVPQSHGHVSMDLSAHYKAPRWPDNAVGGNLTDKQIERYRQQGYYSAEFRDARRELMHRKKARRDIAAQRSGNFVIIDGRTIYSPL